MVRCWGGPPRLVRRGGSPCSLWRRGTLRGELLWGAIDHHGLGKMAMVVTVVVVWPTVLWGLPRRMTR